VFTVADKEALHKKLLMLADQRLSWVHQMVIRTRRFLTSLPIAGMDGGWLMLVISQCLVEIEGLERCWIV
jgi:hypothetical protein